MSNFVNIEVIQTLPFANANRDDAGQPKTVIFGGKTRGRLSSQSLKRAARFYETDAAAGFRTSDRSDTGYYRTRHIKDLVKSAIIAGHGEEVATAKEKVIETILGDKSPLGKVDGKNPSLVTTLVVLTPEEIDRIAEVIVTQDKITFDDIKEIIATSSKKDIALWGRFFASDNASTLDGSAQVSHAITTHAVTIEPDFFVGMDDGADLFADHAGAGHPGDSFYLQGTFYKYANFNIEETVLNLVNADFTNKKQTFDATKVADVEQIVDDITEKFITSFSLAVPQGKIRSTAHTTIPSLIRVSVTSRQPVNAVTAFEEPINSHSTSITRDSVKRLNEEVKSFESILGKPDAAYALVRGQNNPSDVDALGDAVDSLAALVDAVKAQVRPIVKRTVDQLQPRA